MEVEVDRDWRVLPRRKVFRMAENGGGGHGMLSERGLGWSVVVPFFSKEVENYKNRSIFVNNGRTDC